MQPVDETRGQIRPHHGHAAADADIEVLRGTVRRGLIEEVHGTDGAPPYLVHWTDTGSRALTFPGPDARVVTSAELRAEEEIVTNHFSSKHYRPART